MTVTMACICCRGPIAAVGSGAQLYLCGEVRSKSRYVNRYVTMALGGRWQILLGGKLLLASYATRAPLQ